MSYGKFTRNGKEYTILRPDLPRPWFNYLFNEQYHAVISHTGGGFSYARDPKFNRILNYENYSSDRPGRYLYIFDKKDKTFWVPNWQPICEPLESWQCQHGFGYTIISAKHKEIEVKLTYFVPLLGMAEHILVSIKNSAKEDKKLTLFPFFDTVAGDISLELLYPNIMPLYNRAAFDANRNSLLLSKMPTSTRAIESLLTVTSTLPVTHFDTNRDDFLGRFGSLVKPQAIVHGKCSDSLVSGERMLAVLQHDIELASGQELEFGLTLQFFDKPQQYEIFNNPSHPFEHFDLWNEAKEYLDKNKDLIYVKTQLQNVELHWQDKFKVQVETPDDNINLMANNWLQYQLTAITLWRGSSPYHGAEGGLGYRDTAQDVEGLLSLDMKLARSKMETLLSYQYKSGHAVSGFSDIEGPWDLSPENIVAGKSDVAVWIVFTVIAYLKETADFDFLQKEIPFVDGGQATVKEHILRAVRYLAQTVGKNKLPLIMKADWNDAYDRIGANGKGESVWLAMALARALKQSAELFEYLQENDLQDEMEEKYKHLHKLINEIAWEDNCYLAAISDNGYKVGSNKNGAGKLPLNSQTWSVLSQIVPDERKSKILDIIDNKLDTDYGPALFKPAYSEYIHDVGRVSAFSEGTKENAAVFSHAAAFKIVADCMLGRGNEAYSTYCKLLPTNPHKADYPDRYKAEPYVIAEYIVGPDHPYAFGQGEFSWNTGTVPWLYIALTEWIFGVRRTFSGLLLDPCIPENWEKCSIIRPYRGKIYNITIENPEHKQTGVKSIWLDGEEIETNILPQDGDKKYHTVRVLMG